VSTEYDYNSIMQYPSTFASDPDLIANDPANPDYYPLFRVEKVNGRFKKEVLPDWKPWPAFQLSDLDQKGITLMYPWQGVGHAMAEEVASTLLTVAVPRET
jgi:hypothetical protein